MSPENSPEKDHPEKDDLRPEYDMRGGVRGKYLERYKRWTSITRGLLESAPGLISTVSTGASSTAKITTLVSSQLPHLTLQTQFGGAPPDPVGAHAGQDSSRR